MSESSRTATRQHRTLSNGNTSLKKKCLCLCHFITCSCSEFRWQKGILVLVYLLQIGSTFTLLTMKCCIGSVEVHVILEGFLLQHAKSQCGILGSCMNDTWFQCLFFPKLITPKLSTLLLFYKYRYTVHSNLTKPITLALLNIKYVHFSFFLFLPVGGDSKEGKEVGGCMQWLDSQFCQSWWINFLVFNTGNQAKLYFCFHSPCSQNRSANLVQHMSGQSVCLYAC